MITINQERKLQKKESYLFVHDKKSMMNLLTKLNWLYSNQIWMHKLWGICWQQHYDNVFNGYWNENFIRM